MTINRAVNLNGENTIPVWFTSSQLLALAVTTYLAFRRDHSKSWLLLAAGFLFLSVDETAMLHESFGAAIYKDLISEDYGYSDWVYVFSLPIAAGAAILAMLIARFRAVSGWSFWSGTAGLLLWMGTIGFELADSSRPGALILFENTLCHPLHIAEELCEMAGASLLLFAITNYVFLKDPSGEPAAFTVNSHS